MSDRGTGPAKRSDQAARGFSTRAIRAASRAPRLEQTPTTVPIYQTATFTSADADELGEVLAGPRHGYSGRGVAGGMLAFEVEGGRAAGRAVIDAMTLPELTASLGSVHTMVVHPPSTSHRQSSEAELLDSGITPGLLRVSVGLEDVEDLQANLAAALAAIPESALPSRESVSALGAI